ncbi:MAG TPA: hypothetical protein PLO40_01720 [Spirochaetota bacterium]|nr:hypothetical protein [Spirochaetota bacterium]HQF76911.1 hypothetical protein [Spirochaetota bacterium]
MKKRRLFYLCAIVAIVAAALFMNCSDLSAHGGGDTDGQTTTVPPSTTTSSIQDVSTTLPSTTLPSTTLPSTTLGTGGTGGTSTSIDAYASTTTPPAASSTTTTAEPSTTTSTTIDAYATTALWAKSVTAGTSYSFFRSVAVDSLGNIYAAGCQEGTGSYTYGEGVSVAGTCSGDYSYNVVLVKYDSSGTALWAKSVTAGTKNSWFYSVAVDSSGNIYAAGYQSGTGSYTYGEGVSVSGTYAGSSSYNGNNVVLVKYNSSGTALWAKSVTAGTNDSSFYSVAVDSSGNIYAAGSQRGTESYTYGEGVSVAGSSSGRNVVLVKYNSSGAALWAKSVTAGTNSSYFNSVAIDSSGNIYAAGNQEGTESYTYGEGVSVAGSSSGRNVVLVKYNSSGAALWAKSVTAGTNSSYFNSVAIDSSGNIYAAGNQEGTESYTYGEGVSVAGIPAWNNVILVKYNSSGTALWAKSVTAGTSYSAFGPVAVDSSGNIYAAGVQSGAENCTYGDGVSVAGTYADGSSVVLVKYNSSGAALWAKSVTTGTKNSWFGSVAVDSSGNVYAAGDQEGTGSYTYGDGVSVAGTGLSNAVIVKYGAP